MADAMIAALGLSPESRVVDATLGRGGHSARILAELGPQGRLLALDRDPQAVAEGGERLGADPRVMLIQQPFSRLGEALASAGWGAADAVLADLGVSSPQLEEAGRGFSFRAEGPLDMRMDTDSGQTAARWLAETPSAELERVLREYGEERHARRVARAIASALAEGALRTTTDLAEVVRAAVPGKGEPGKDKATRTFQAVRMAVNDEMGELDAFLEAATGVLRPGGRLAVIAFHSVEDRRVKHFIREAARECICPPELPVCRCDKAVRLRPVGKPLKPDAAEQQRNPRSRSAIARVAEKVGE
jgi:16S rRNA (cytosine1402-N4)-methyltransferase